MNNERKHILEDKPQMRSMQLMSAAPVLMMPRMTPIAKQHLSPLLFKPQHDQISSGWTLSALAPLPPIYCLERTHIYVDDEVDQVANRIAECLRKESVATVFQAEENVIDAETADHVQFSVRLWQGKETNVLVEVQKVSGCCYQYCQSAKAVLRAAKGIRAPPKRRTFSIPPCVPKVSEEERTAATRDGLEAAEGLLKRQHLDAHLLAVESLVHLSKVTENQCLTARSILSGEFRAKVLSLVESSEENHNEINKEHNAVMRRHALSILANCLAALEQSGELSSILQQQEDLTSTGIISALVSDVAAARDRPHDACQAANCLRTLLAASEDIKRKAADLNVNETIAQARQMGACRHAGLEDACTKFRTLL